MDDAFMSLEVRDTPDFDGALQAQVGNYECPRTL